MKIVQPITINDAALLSSNVPEVLYPNYDAGYVYASGARVHVIAADVHQVYESLQAENVGHNPADERYSETPVWWIFVSATNPWLMFDKSVTSQTENPDSIQVSIQASGRVPCLGLMNVSGASVHVTVTDAVDGVVYDETYSLVSTSGINNWYDYFFEPIVRVRDLILVNLPLYASPIIDVTISASGETVKCGTLILGPITDAGDTEYGVAVGIQDFSVKAQDDFGNYAIVERAYRKRATFPVVVPHYRVDTLADRLAALRATPVLYIGADNYTSSAIYGFYNDFTIEIAYPLESVLSIEIEGLT